MTDGDVPLDGEGRKGERRGVHGKELGGDHEGAACAAPEPHVAQDVVRENLLQDTNMRSGNCEFQHSQLKVLNEKINLTQTLKLSE